MSAIQLLQITTEELTNLIKDGIRPELDLLIKKCLKDQSNQEEFLTRQEVAIFFKVSLACIHDWMNKGIITPYKMGNRTYFKKSDLISKLQSSNTND